MKATFLVLCTSLQLTIAIASLSNVTVPLGFCASMFFDGNVPHARSLSPSQTHNIVPGASLVSLLITVGDAAPTDEPQVYALIDANGDGRAEAPLITVVSNLNQPMGVAWHDGDLYIAEITKVHRIRSIDSKVMNGTLNQSADLELITDVFSSDEWHGQKFIAFGPDNKLYVPVGANCNVCPLATWFPGPPALTYGSLFRMNTDGSELETFASGIRNTVGFDWHPDTGELWFTDNGRDKLGDNKPDDELNRAPTAGLNFGFPFCHTEGAGDPYRRDTGPPMTFSDPELAAPSGVNCSSRTPAVQALGPHVAALGMMFYTGTAFPKEYNRSIFIAEHGSWNRDEKIGYRVVEIRLGDNGTVLEHNPFMTGWLELCNAAPDGAPCGRPVHVVQYYDGSLLVSDDGNGAVYRVAYGDQCESNTTTAPPGAPPTNQTLSEASVANASFQTSLAFQINPGGLAVLLATLLVMLVPA